MTIKHREKFFFLGLFLFYLIVFLAPNKPIYFSAYFVATFFFYLASKDIRPSLLYSLILSFFSDVGLAGSLFLMEPRWLKLGSGWWISPLTVMAILLLPLSLKRQIKSIQLADIMTFLFFGYCIFSFAVFPYTNVFFGIINLGEIILAYFLMRIYFSKENLIYVSYILISMFAFQSLVGALQFIFQRPLGILAESSTFTYPFGLATIEEEHLSRLTGTFGHPNYLASFLLTTLPFLLLYPARRFHFIFILMQIVSFLALFFTYSRVAWLIFILMVVFILFQKKNIFQTFPKITLGRAFLFSTLFLALFIFIAPYLLVRLESFPVAFREGGSMDVRFKLWQEGLNLVSQYPLTGVGLNRSLEVYSMEPITDIFEKRRPSKFYSIHNTFLEIATEVGIPGALFFSLFLIFIVKSYFSQKRPYPKNAAFMGLLALLGISLFNPFFHSSQFRLFFLLAAMILG